MADDGESGIGERQPFVPDRVEDAPNGFTLRALNGDFTVTASGDVVINGATLDAATLAIVLGVLAGGTTGQTLTKASNADYDFGWA